ncbi:hypothetical protein [Micromonospora fulviviridis]|uniref:Immunity protein 63 domain-containing protein n=1 Tax=Micromonospora fulviviridis TaxID=47860 RepID=A0ABV2VIM6_9ACTN
MGAAAPVPGKAVLSADITFALDQFGLPVYEADDPRYEALGVWLITDVSRSFLVCLDGLAMVDDVSHGQPPFEEWSSDKFDVTFGSDGVSMRNQWLEYQHGEYTVTEVREVLERYWGFLVSVPERTHLIREYRPDLPEWQAALLRWEERWGRPHPYRGRLF